MSELFAGTSSALTQRIRLSLHYSLTGLTRWAQVSQINNNIKQPKFQTYLTYFYLPSFNKQAHTFILPNFLLYSGISKSKRKTAVDLFTIFLTAIMRAFCFNIGRNRAKQHKNMKDRLLNYFILTIFILSTL